ncbi:MAG: hypothetical protein ACRCZF_05985, partial [Gemmataceae bacterium]
MQILLVVILTAATATFAWPAPPAGLAPPAVVALVAIMTLVPLGLTGILSRATVVGLRHHPAERHRIAQQYTQRRRRIGLLTLGLFLVGLPLSGWGHVITQSVGILWQDRWVLGPLAEFLIPLPYLIF